jgi:hypothetical protein
MAEMFLLWGKCDGTLARGRLRFGFEIAEVRYSRNNGGDPRGRTPFKFA